MIKKLKKAIDTVQRAQRNYNLSKTIPNEDLEMLIYAATNSPSKQNETHYSLRVYTDQNLIRHIYNHTKRFGLNVQEHNLVGEIDGKFWQNEERSVHNSQILANVLFAYVDDDGESRNGEHMLARQNKNNSSVQVLDRQKNYSIGISIGQLILSAGLLGYKTGICTAFNKPLAEVINTEKEVKVLVGIGYENVGTDRRLHAETLNKDLPERFRNGSADMPWRFPSFDKTTKVYLNDTFLD